MPNYKRGEVVIVSIPADKDRKTQERRRPAVIISNDKISARLDYVLAVPISQEKEVRSEACAVLVRKNSPEGKSGGLTVDSVIDCTVISTIPIAWLVQRIGRFPAELIGRIDEALAASLGISGVNGDYSAAMVPRKPSPPRDETAIELPLPGTDAPDDTPL